jgi:phosphatidylglycerophosphatase C
VTVRTVAAFDFDKTLSSRDNVLPFLRSLCGPAAVGRALAAVSPLLVAAGARDEGRDRAKAALLRRLLAGRTEADVRERGLRFASEVVDRHLRPDIVERATWHATEGHERVLISASLAVYLEPIAAQLGFDAALGTPLAVDGDGRLTGELAGANVRRAEKVRRLDAWLGDGTAVVWAYGDSRGDRELLARADHPVWVGRPRRRSPAGSTV